MRVLSHGLISIWRSCLLTLLGGCYRLHAVFWWRVGEMYCKCYIGQLLNSFDNVQGTSRISMCLSNDATRGKICNCILIQYAFSHDDQLFGPLPTVDGHWADWADWPPCSVSCGNGTKQRLRECVGPIYGGAECLGPWSERRTCFVRQCPGLAGITFLECWHLVKSSKSVLF